MDSERFAQALEAAAREAPGQNGIGTLGEKTLHAALKHYLEPFSASHEVKVGPYVADIVGEGGIVEVQTQGFHHLRGKLAAFLEVAPVTVAYPIPHTKWITWIDPETGQATPRRRSPKVGTVYDAFYELYKIKGFLQHPNLRLHLLLLEVEDFRLLNGWSRDRKRGSTRQERLPIRLVDEVELAGPQDYGKLVPQGLPEPFTTRDYARVAKLRLNRAQTALNVLHHLGRVQREGKRDRMHLYRASP